MVAIISALVGSVIALFAGLLGIWFKHYLDNKPIAKKESLFSDPEECPKRSSSGENMISTINSQCVEFDFSKGVNTDQQFVSIVYKFGRFGILSKFDYIEFEIVFEDGNFNQLDFELQTPNDVLEPIKTTLHPEDKDQPIRVVIPLKDYTANKLHNVNVVSFVVWRSYHDEDSQHPECYGKYRIQNLALRKK